MTLLLFWIFLIASGVVFFYHLIRVIFAKTLYKENADIDNIRGENLSLFKYMHSRWLYYCIPLGIALLIWALFSMLPYFMQMSDIKNLSFSRKNIQLFEEYREDYTQSAKKQIEEYQKSQAEMVKKADYNQVEFWNKQVDEVGNALTEKVKYFNDRIFEERIKVNKIKASLETRLENKLFWGLD